jgi:probable phosphoglycerate mutase
MITHRQFYYVRHGQTDWNLNRMLQGNTDIPLNDTGLAQAQIAREKLAGQPVATIVSSPLQRARKTADIINTDLSCPIIELEGLRECSFGIHEGTTDYDWLGDWLSGDASTTPPEVEPFEDFVTRGLAAINKAINHPGPVLIVAHGGIYIPVNKTLGKTSKSSLPNCQPVRLDPPEKSRSVWKETWL